MKCVPSSGPFFTYGGSDGKVSACSAGDLGSIPGLGRSPGEGNGNPLQYSCLERVFFTFSLSSPLKTHNNINLVGFREAKCKGYIKSPRKSGQSKIEYSMFLFKNSVIGALKVMVICIILFFLT